MLLSSGNLAGTQAIISVLKQRCADGPSLTNVLGAKTMFDVVRLVSDAMRETEKRDAGHLKANKVGFNASFVVGGQLDGEPMRLFIEKRLILVTTSMALLLVGGIAALKLL